MSTEIQTVQRDPNAHGEESIELTQFCGPARAGDRKMVQVTLINNDGEIGHIQLSRGEAVRLANRLTEWASGNAIMGH